jgi:RNA polymerase sigma factor (sigma-70 family)
MNPPHLFEANLDVIERAIARVCREARLERMDAEDFASTARLALLADDCAVLRKFEGRSSLATYLTIVVRRLRLDARREEWRWHTSAEAQRRGPAAVDFERLTRRDGRSFAEAAELIRGNHPDVTARELEELAASLPQRAPKPVLVHVADGDEERLAGSGTAADRVDALDAAERSERANDAVRMAMATMSAQDRVILRLRFSRNASIASIARGLGVEQRPLYRRIEALMATLRRALAGAGIDAASAEALIGRAEERLDFGLQGKTGDSSPSMKGEDG